MRYLVGDVETTGLGDPPDVAVCEFAIAEIDAELNVIEVWETLVNPGIPISETASKLNGITNEMVCRPEIPTMAAAMAFIAGPDGFGEVALICHNIRFDRKFFKPYLNIVAELCTLETARRVLPKVRNHRLGTLREELSLQVQAEHEAAGDILIVVDLLRHLVPLTQRTLPQLVAAAARPMMLYTMPFGKDKGKEIVKLDRDYRNWLLQQEISPDLRYTLEKLRDARI